MDILKYFYEEPTSLEVLTPALNPDAKQHNRPLLSLEELLHAPRYYRAYWAGSNLAEDRVGLTALRQPAAFVDPLVDAFGELSWWQVSRAKAVQPVAEEDRAAVLAAPADVAALVATPNAQPDTTDLIAVTAGSRRETLPALRTLLDAGAVVAFPEPAHHGFDWSFFSKTPLRERLTAALRARSYPNVRRFIVPFQRARSEQKFYFETWMLDDLPNYIEEIL